MARPERNNVDYFPHPVTHGRKMFYLRSKFKNDGYTVWFMLLEALGKTDYHYLDLADEVQLMYLSSEFMVSNDTLIEIINALVKFGEFDPVLWKEKILFSDKFIESIKDAYERRNNNVVQKQGLCSTLISKGRLKTGFMLKLNDSNTQRIGKDRIEEDSKVKYAEFVTLTLEEYNKLIIKFGNDFTRSCIEVLDNYKGSKGVKYKSDYRTILNWVVDRVKKDSPQFRKQIMP